MKFDPILRTAEMFVEIHKDDFLEFRELIISKQPPISIPADYRVIEIVNTGYITEVSGTILVRVQLQFVGQQKV